jgi:hypothetical protein
VHRVPAPGKRLTRAVLVYGDRSERADPQGRLEQIAEQAEAIESMSAGIVRHSRLVGALIDVGQLLQGVADADFREFGADRRTPGTDALTIYVCGLAEAVCRSWDSGFAAVGQLPGLLRFGELPTKIELRTPEGFAFYGVYPEAYIEAARRLRLAAPARVIGIRSIGTTLAAVVAAALNTSPPVTLRPHGEPFAREITIAPELERELLEGDAHYLIVDEGPGQSGSSFGAVADWLEAQGVPLERIALLPSHSRAPGPQASGAHRVRWKKMQRVPADFADELPDLLRKWVTSAASLETPLTDVSAGEWRPRVYSREEEWSAAMPAWERRKFLANAHDGRLLLKFAGLGRIGERKLRMARALHSAGLTPEPLGLVHGFLVERWCDARVIGDGEKPLAEIARYIATRVRLFPAAADRGATLDQLFEMSRRNVSLAFGDSAAGSLERWARQLDVLSRRVGRVRTDNKLDRHEWLRLSDGRLLKTDALDHHAGHDLIGCQDMAWDVAGAIIEFSLDARETDALIGATERYSGRNVDRELLEFYRVAYLAFRLGQASFAAQNCASDAAETARLKAAADRYAADLQAFFFNVEVAREWPESEVG